MIIYLMISPKNITNKKMRSMAIINIINADNSTQTDFYRDNGMTVNLKDFRE